MSGLPDGRWDGWYEQGGARSPQSQHLVFVDGVLRGEGDDELGPFDVSGEYSVSSPTSGRVAWVKTYRGSHSVLYLGEWDGADLLGTWEIWGMRGRFGFVPPGSR
jgi:hypothetical protein